MLLYSRPLAMRCALFGCWSRGGLKRRTAFAQVANNTGCPIDPVPPKMPVSKFCSTDTFSYAIYYVI